MKQQGISLRWGSNSHLVLLEDGPQLSMLRTALSFEHILVGGQQPSCCYHHLLPEGDPNPQPRCYTTGRMHATDRQSDQQHRACTMTCLSSSAGD